MSYPTFELHEGYGYRPTVRTMLADEVYDECEACGEGFHGENVRRLVVRVDAESGELVTLCAAGCRGQEIDR